jgi:hypothetical protein
MTPRPIGMGVNIIDDRRRRTAGTLRHLQGHDSERIHGHGAGRSSELIFGRYPQLPSVLKADPARSELITRLAKLAMARRLTHVHTSIHD